MYIIPSLYIRDNQTVALAQGGSIYDSNPVEMAKKLSLAGAEIIYLVDLNTPPAGHPQHIDIIKQIIDETNLKIQLSGHIKSADVVERYFSAGVETVVPGTIAYQKPDFLKDICNKFPRKIGVHIEVRGGKVVIRGWTVAAKKTALDYAEQFTEAGVGTIFYSDVDEEGILTPADITRVSTFLNQSPLPVMHATDVNSKNELELVLGLASQKILGTVIGKSMYSGNTDIATLITHAKETGSVGLDEPTLIP